MDKMIPEYFVFIWIKFVHIIIKLVIFQAQGPKIRL